MVGMNQIKKKLITGICIGFGIGLLAVGGTLWWSISTIKSYENGTNKKYNKLYTQDVAVLNRDVIQGEVITSEMVTTVNIHKRTVPTGALSMSEIVGGVAKFNIPASIPITTSMIADEIVSADVRSQEVNVIVMPSDLVSGDYVDIRIMYPNGTDYIVLAQKQVGEISGSTLWLTLNEDERLILNGAMVDAFLNDGTKLYATKYTDPEAQVKIADETNEKFKGYMLEAIAKEFGLDVSSSEIKSASKVSDDSDDEDSTSKSSTSSSSSSKVSADVATMNKIFNLVTKYKNYAATLTRTTENYQPNEQIIAMMNSNANVLQDAKKKLSLTARLNIENGLNKYKEVNEENYDSVVDGANKSIDDQRAERENYLGV